MIRGKELSFLKMMLKRKDNKKLINKRECNQRMEEVGEARSDSH